MEVSVSKNYYFSFLKGLSGIAMISLFLYRIVVILATRKFLCKGCYLLTISDPFIGGDVGAQ